MKDAANRRYNDACAMAHGLELVGDRWALLVVRELLLGPRRFSAVRKGLPGISANVLTQRLEELEARQILTHTVNDEGQPVYALTPWGYQLRPVVYAVARFGLQSEWHDPMRPMSKTSLLLSLEITFLAEKAGGIDLVGALDMKPNAGQVTIRDGVLTVARGRADHPDFCLAGKPNALLFPIYGKMPIEAAVEAGLIEFSGDRAKAQAFIDCIELPDGHPYKGVLAPSS